MVTDTIVGRIIENHQLYEARNKRKLEKARLEAELEEAEHSKRVRN